MSGFREISKDAAREALTAAAWAEQGEDFDPCPNCGWHAKEPRTLVHCFFGGFGADWSLDSALDLLDKANRVAWIVSLFGHDLAIEDDERVRTFDVPAPQHIRDEIMAEAKAAAS